MDIVIPEFYIFIAGIIILILMIFICLYYFWIRRTKISNSLNNTQRTPITNINESKTPTDYKESHPAWLATMMDGKPWYLFENERGFELTTDTNKITKYRYHQRDSNLLKDLHLQIPMLAKQTAAFESGDSILEIRYLEATKVYAILRYQKHTGYVTKYFHIINGKLVLDDNSNNQVIFDIPGYWHW